MKYPKYIKTDYDKKIYHQLKAEKKARKESDGILKK